jgi:transporter family protein
MSIPILALIISSFAIGLVAVLNKKLSGTGHKSSTYTLVIAIVSTLLSVPLLFYRFKVPGLWGFWLLAVVSAATFGLSNMFSYKAYKLTDASVVSLIHRLSIVVAVILGITVLGEIYTPGAYLGLILIIVSSVIILYEDKKITLNRGVAYAIVMALLSGLAGVMDKIVLREFSSFTYVFVNNLLIVLPFAVRNASRSEAVKLYKQHWPLITLISALMTGSWAIFLFVLQNHDVSRIIPVYKSLSLIVPVLLGILVLKETGKLWQKIAGTVIGVLGIVLLALK